MLKKLVLTGICGLWMMNLSGCFLLVAGVAGGAGTAVWLSGKLTQEFHASYHHTIDAANATMHSMGLQITKETQDDNVTQIKGIYNDGREMWIDIERINDQSTKVEVRVGGVSADKDAASVVLKNIQNSL